jgi:hypothetical protein
MRYKIVSIKKVPDDFNYVVGVIKIPGTLSKLFGGKPTRARYYGRSSVWYAMPSMSMVFAHGLIFALIAAETREEYECSLHTS